MTLTLYLRYKFRKFRVYKARLAFMNESHILLDYLVFFNCSDDAKKYEYNTIVTDTTDLAHFPSEETCLDRKFENRLSYPHSN